MTENVNYSLDPDKSKNETTAEDSGSSKMKLIIFIAVGVVLLGSTLGLLISRISAGMDNDDLSDELTKSKSKVSDLTAKNTLLTKQVEALTAENAEYKHRNEELEVRNKELTEDNEDLSRQLELKEVQIRKLNAANVELIAKIDALNRKIEVMLDQMKELRDYAEELYTDTRLIVGILNQELNRNQALQKAIDSLEDQLEEQGKLIGQKELKIQKLTEDLLAEKILGGRTWLVNEILTSVTGKRLQLNPVYNNTGATCDAKKFHDAAGSKKPNMFIATERATGAIFGGYTSQDWTGSESKNDLAAFTFSVSNRLSCKVPKDGINAIKTDQTKILTFGTNDIVIGDSCVIGANNIINLNATYICPNVTSPKYFYTENTKPQLEKFEFYEALVI